jgi:hypothetical protein
MSLLNLMGCWKSSVCGGNMGGAGVVSSQFLRGFCWKYALESTGFDPLVGSDGFDTLWCKSPNGPQML